MSNKLNGARLLTADWATVPPLLNTKEAAKALNVSVSFLAKSRCEGTIGERTAAPKFVKIGKRVRYKKQELQRWLEDLQEHGA